MTKRPPNRMFLQGLLAAATRAAEITGKYKVSELSDQSWKLICEVNLGLFELAKAEAERLDND